MQTLDLPPLEGAAGCVRLPGSKSISNRVLLLAALADGETEIRDLLSSDDTDRMLDALQRLGVDVSRSPQEGTCRIRGGAGELPRREADLFLGNAGTAFRPLTAVLALSGGHYRLSGVPRMHERPIGDLVEALRAVGARIACTGQEGYPPLEILPGRIRIESPVRVRGDVSSQFLTALLMALPLTGEEVVIDVLGELISKPYIEITLNLMARFGVEVRREGWQRFRLPAGACYRSPGTIFVEGDASSASYFLAAGAIGGGPVRVEGVGRRSIQGDVRFTEALEQMGARIGKGDNWIECAASQDHRLRAFDLDLNHIPDAAMTLAVLALFAEGPSVLRNIGSWRVKETDRIHALGRELRKVGGEVEEGTDWLRVTPPRQFCSATIDTYDDHRMAMCLSLVTLAGVGLRINDPQCVAKTFPDYFERFARIGVQAAPVVAIDGPSASGKGTVAAAVARRLGFHYLDSGALYRLVALMAMREGVALDAEEVLSGLARDLPAHFDGEHVLLSGEDVGSAIRAEEVSNGASRIAAYPGVRAALLARQRAFRAAPGLVAEGRDMGTVVFPAARVKVFLTASVEARAERRHKQLMEKGLAANIDDLLQDLRDRDARDTNRRAAPLQMSTDAVPLDTTDLTVDQAVEFVIDLVRARLPGGTCGRD
ncbi:MAG: bifunctional 3-phosphoshikimate 1-carboxyvinyltransferase/cytidylate kinase [Betaproteobacteria bacterium]|nr:bifunctional 3-phosphoshikimate 1-carboxyvinyltransferase/cytidylate kinase [Betaproteobacteria bacterium]